MPEDEPVLKRRYGETLSDYDERKRVIAEAKRKAREGKHEIHIYEERLAPIVPHIDDITEPSTSNKRLGVEQRK